MRGGKLREQGDTELLDGVNVNTSDWHGQRLSPSVVATCRSCGGVADIRKGTILESSIFIYLATFFCELSHILQGYKSHIIM